MNEAIVLAKSEEPGASVLMRRATDVAGVCGEIVKRTAQQIQGKKYVKVEGWQSIANAFGCVASARDVEEVQGGFRAIGEVRRLSDGVVISTGEGFVGDDEKTWASRPIFARRAMVQTRAISRACRAAFAFVVVMIDSNLSTTPAEEMEGVIEAERPVGGSATAALKSKVAAVVNARPSPPKRATPPEPPPLSDNDAPFAREAEQEAHPAMMTFGSGKGKPLSELKDKDLGWYLRVLTENVDDPAKARFVASNRAALEAIEEEMSRRGA